MDFLSLLKNRDMQTNALIIFIAISCLQFLDAKILMAITALLLIAVNYPSLMKLSDDKPQIKQAVESVFDVKVKSVRTLIMYGEERRVGRFSGKTSNWKKAYVKLHEDYSLQHLFVNEEEE